MKSLSVALQMKAVEKFLSEMFFFFVFFFFFTSFKKALMFEWWSFKTKVASSTCVRGSPFSRSFSELRFQKCIYLSFGSLALRH